jgi:hypothetical protein
MKPGFGSEAVRTPRINAGGYSPVLASPRDVFSQQSSRSIGFGGDGATWGNYSLVWKDTNTGGLVSYDDTNYSNGNDFHFTAVGVNTPALWREWCSGRAWPWFCYVGS